MTTRIPSPRDPRPKTTPQQRRSAQAKRRLEQADAERARAQEQAAAKTEERRLEREAQRVAVAQKRAAWAGLNDIDAEKLVNVVKNRPEPDVYALIRDWLARNGHGVRVPSGSPLDGARAELPPPRADSAAKAPPPGTVSHADASQRAEQARRAHDRAQRLVARDRADREAYRDALAKHGLMAPENGCPTGGGTSGFGL